MSSNPLPSSLRSSVGSKSTNAGPIVGGGAAEEDGSLYHPDDRSRALCSSWISRLHLQHLLLPPASRPTPLDRRSLPLYAGPEAAGEAGDGAGLISQNNKRSTSTDESCTPTSINDFNSSFVVRRYGDLFGRRAAGFLRRKSPPSRIVYGGDEGDGPVGGFGPFQVRSRNPGISRGTARCPRCDLVRGERFLGKGRDYGDGGCFPLVRRMAHFGMIREHAHDEEDEMNRGNARFPSRRAPCVGNQVKLSPLFQLRPSCNSDYSIDRNKGIVSLSIDEGSPTNLQRNLMRPMALERWHLPMPMSWFKSQDLVDGSPSRKAYEQNFSINPWHASCASVQAATRSRGGVYHDGVDAAAPVPANGSMMAKSLGKVPFCAPEPEEPFSFWKMGKYNRRNTISSASATELRTNNLGLKRSADFESFFPQKSTRLSNED